MLCEKNKTGPTRQDLGFISRSTGDDVGRVAEIRRRYDERSDEAGRLRRTNVPHVHHRGAKQQRERSLSVTGFGDLAFGHFSRRASRKMRLLQEIDRSGAEK